MGGCCGVCSCHVHTSCVPRAAVRCRPVCSPRFSALSVSGARARLASGFSKGRWFVGVGSCIASFRDGVVRGRPFLLSLSPRFMVRFVVAFCFRCRPTSWCNSFVVVLFAFAFVVASLRGALRCRPFRIHSRPALWCVALSPVRVFSAVALIRRGLFCSSRFFLFFLSIISFFLQRFVSFQ